MHICALCIPNCITQRLIFSDYNSENIIVPRLANYQSPICGVIDVCHLGQNQVEPISDMKPTPVVLVVLQFKKCFIIAISNRLNPPNAEEYLKNK